MVSWMCKMGFEMVILQGVFYVFVKILVVFGSDDFVFVKCLVKEGWFGLIFGFVFGDGGEGYVCLLYVVVDEKIEEVMNCFEVFV